ncbi:MAG: DUF6767 domain-containing protein [Nocardioides sp.]
MQEAPVVAPVPRCPVRPREPCTLCKPGATGPADCPLVWLVMQDPELREQLRVLREEEAAARRPAPGRRPAAQPC